MGKLHHVMGISKEEFQKQRSEVRHYLKELRKRGIKQKSYDLVSPWSRKGFTT